MKWIKIMLILVLMSQIGICSIQQAGKCLKDLEASILPSSQAYVWRGMRSTFLSTIDQVTDIADMGVLLRQLRHLEYYIKDTIKSHSWNQWERQYWKVLTDPDINVKHTVTRFITTLMLIENNLLPAAFSDSWKNGKRSEWSVGGQNAESQNPDSQKVENQNAKKRQNVNILNADSQNAESNNTCLKDEMII